MDNRVAVKQYNFTTLFGVKALIHLAENPPRSEEFKDDEQWIEQIENPAFRESLFPILVEALKYWST